MELQVGVKILLEDKDGKYLMVCRSEGSYPGIGGQWEIIGGRIEPGTSLIDNLKREVAEETGLEILGLPKLIAAQDILNPDKDRHIVRLTYVGEGKGEVKLSQDHTDFKWLQLSEISKLDKLDPYLKEVLQTMI